MDTPFGALVTPNITPDDETGIGKWTADDLYRAMHDGVNKAGQDLYPVMPYTFFTKVTRADVDDIYAYLRTVKPVANRVDVNQLRFPFDIRLTQMAWRELYFTEGTFVPGPDQERAVESRRLSGRRSRPLRRLPFAAHDPGRHQARRAADRARMSITGSRST